MLTIQHDHRKSLNYQRFQLLLPSSLLVTVYIRSNYKAVKKYSKKLQIALANGPIKWYSIHKPVQGAILRTQMQAGEIDYKFLISNDYLMAKRRKAFRRAA